jgi:glycosyltransferase involved in cell wall biosynthesis
MRVLKKMIPSRIKAPVWRLLHPSRYPVELRPQTRVKRGRVLFSYMALPLTLPADAPRLQMHSAYQRCREFARIFTELGYHVDAIDWNDQTFVPKNRYDVVFDICLNLARLEPFYSPNTVKLLYCTGSDPYYQNAAELKRVEAVNQRRNGNYEAKRLVLEPKLATRSLEISDVCLLLGSEYTRQTYPESLRDKIQLIPTYAPPLGERAKQPHEYVPAQREFLWFAGNGAVHKGLDLVLEVFARNPDLTLHVVGNVAAETDFMQMYEAELTGCANIHYHGFLKPNSEKFKEILATTFAFVAPTCSEAISSAVAHSLQTGLYPIISRDTGIILPDGCGTYLEDCTIDEIEAAVRNTYKMGTAHLTEQIALAQQMAQRDFSKDDWAVTIKSRIAAALA